MYQLADVQSLLSKNTESLLLNNSSVFTEVEKQASEIVLTNVTVAVPPQDWVKMPFVWILEYIIQNKFSGQSKELLDMTMQRYDEAIRILESHNIAQNNSTSSKVVPFNEIYNQEV